MVQVRTPKPSTVNGCLQVEVLGLHPTHRKERDEWGSRRGQNAGVLRFAQDDKIEE
jgi:hypothetical protein